MTSLIRRLVERSAANPGRGGGVALSASGSEASAMGRGAGAIRPRLRTRFETWPEFEPPGGDAPFREEQHDTLSVAAAGAIPVARPPENGAAVPASAPRRAPLRSAPADGEIRQTPPIRGATTAPAARARRAAEPPQARTAAVDSRDADEALNPPAPGAAAKRAPAPPAPAEAEAPPYPLRARRERQDVPHSHQGNDALVLAPASPDPIESKSPSGRGPPPPATLRPAADIPQVRSAPPFDAPAPHSSRLAPGSGSERQAPPRIEVRIARIEVSAQYEAAPPVQRAAPTLRTSLDDYLKRRDTPE
jgi:hypothetical protein